jgi:hypothetical protein
MASARYQDALFWMAANDDTEWVANNDPISVTASLVADLFSKTDEQVREDLTKAVQARQRRTLEEDRLRWQYLMEKSKE